MKVKLDSISKARISALLDKFADTVLCLSYLQAEDELCERQVGPGNVCVPCENSRIVYTFQDIISKVVEHKEWGDLFVSAVETKISTILNNWDEQVSVLKDFISLSVHSQEKTTLFFMREHISIETLLNVVCKLSVNHIQDKQALVNTVGGFLNLTEQYNNIVGAVLPVDHCAFKVFEDYEREEDLVDAIFNDITKENTVFQENPLVKEVLDEAFRIYQEKAESGKAESGKEEAQD